MSFTEAYEEFKIYSKNRYKKQGFDNLVYDFNYKVLPYFKGYDIFDISKKDILRWQDTILTFNYSNSYNKRLYFVFNAFLDYCVLYYDLPFNMLRQIGPFKKKIEKKKTDFYTYKDFNNFIKGVHIDIYRLFFTFMFLTGARPSEAMALKFSNIKGNYVYFEYNIQRKGKRELDTLKTKSSENYVLLCRRLKKELLKLQKSYIKKYGNTNYDYFVFGGLKPLAPTSIDRYKAKACMERNIRPITQHQFRHSFATNLISKGIPLNVVSRLLRHNDITTTTKFYIHQDLAQEKRVLRTLNSVYNLFNNLVYDFKQLHLLKHFTMF